MRPIIALIATIGMFTMAGCAWQNGHHHEGDDVKPVSTHEHINFDSETATADERAACEAVGGEVRPDGLAGWENCIQSYADAGKACTDSSECQGRCLADGIGTTGEVDAGTCQQTDSPFGCFAEMENGQVGPGLCVD